MPIFVFLKVFMRHTKKQNDFCGDSVAEVLPPSSRGAWVGSLVEED